MTKLKSTPLFKMSKESALSAIKVVVQTAPASLMQPLPLETMKTVNQADGTIQTAHPSAVRRRIANSLRRKPLFILKGEMREPPFSNTPGGSQTQERHPSMVFAIADLYLSFFSDLDVDVSETVMANCNIKNFSQMAQAEKSGPLLGKDGPSVPLSFRRNPFCFEPLLWVGEVRTPMMAKKILNLATQGSVTVTLSQEDD